MERQEFFYPSCDGEHQIHAVLWIPEGKPRGVVQITHGICEYILRYEPFARFLAENGYVVAGNDHLGHGQTAKGPEEYGFFTDWQQIVQDVHTLRVKVGEKYPHLPYFLLGHSMGSFVARTYLIDYPGTLKGCLLSGTGQESAFNVTLGKFLTGMGDPHKVNKLFYSLSIGAYNKKFKPNRTPADWISRDEAVVDAYLKDPLCTFPTRAGMNHAMMCGLEKIADRNKLVLMDKLTPIYIYSGDQDPVGNMGQGVRKVETLFRQSGCFEVTVKLYPGGRHEMHNEINRDEVFCDVLEWLDAHAEA